MKILVTGGGGYIGAHTIVDLIQHGFEVISVDNHSRSTPIILEGVAKIVQQPIVNYKIDLCDAKAAQQIFEQHPDIQGIIHFAAYKSVPESVVQPYLYYNNNINSLLNILQFTLQYNIPYLVFSSSCSVYGNPKQLPVTEESPLQTAESPYAHTKQIGEDMIHHFAKAQKCVTNAILLRYFNPVGAHPSALIGELPLGKPENLVPYITQTAIGKRKALTIFGDDYDTRDGTCIRDYIHVSDIAHAHTKALQYSMTQQQINPEIFNLGTGEGVSVLELIQAFERITQQSLPYQIGKRRAGDVVKIFADNKKARQILGWIPQFTVEDMMETAWKWEEVIRR